MGGILPSPLLPHRPREPVVHFVVIRAGQEKKKTLKTEQIRSSEKCHWEIKDSDIY